VAIVIREADILVDRQMLIGFLYQHLTKQSDDRRFDWLYLHNPHGRARAWIAMDTDTQAVVGVAGAFPRKVYIGRCEELGWVLGDFCMSPRYRSLGPAVQLQRACLAEVNSGKVAFCYDFPSTNMTAIYKRLGIHSFGQMLRLAKPLCIDRKIEGIIKMPLIARVLSTPGNFLLALHDLKPESSGTLTISLYEGNCGKEFSILAQQIGGQYGACVQRSAEYLNWRYLANPLRRYELLTAHRDGSLLAYAVFTHTGKDAMLVDLFGIEELIVLRSLVDRLVVLLRKRGVITLSASMLESHPWVGLLQRSGFRPRETNPVVIYTPGYAPSEVNTFKDVNWFLMQGDRDV